MRKKLFAVIMSAMMMITFMPTMAFAVDASDPVWSGYDGATVTYGTSSYYLDSVRELQANGQIKVYFTDLDTELGAQGASGDELIAVKAKFNAAIHYYYDFTGAKLIKLDGKFLDSKYTTTSSFDAVFNGGVAKIRFTRPTGVTGEKYGYAMINSTYLNNDSDNTCWKFNFDKPEYDADSTAEQKFTVPVVLTTGTTVDYSTLNPGLVNADKLSHDFVLALTKAPSLTVDDAKGHALGTEPGYNPTFDGKEHKLVLNNAGDNVVVFQKMDTKTGLWSDVASATFKDAEKTYYRYQIKKSGTDTVEANWKYWTVDVDQADVSLALTALYDGASYETTYDCVCFYSSSDYVNKFVKSNEAKLKKAVEAGYKIKITDSQNPGSVHVVIEFTENNEKACKEIKDLFGKNVDVDFDIVEDDDDYSVDPITNNMLVTCNSSKTFHVKKAGKLKAKKTFKIKNDFVRFGSASYYKQSGNSKIVIAKNGKVTVKKGLKKGKYTVKLKVFAPNTPSLLTGSKTLTIRIAK